MPDLGLIDQFLNKLSDERGFSTNTLSAYRNDLKQFAEYLQTGQAALSGPANTWADVTRNHIMSFVLHLKDRGYVQTSVARKVAAVKSFYRYLSSTRVVSSNPAEELTSPHVDRALPHTVSPSDLDR